MLARKKKKYQDKWKLRPQSELIIALDDLEFSWFPEEAEKAIKLWGSGCHIKEITKELYRDDPDEVAVLFMHLARQGKIQLRENGVFGA